LPDGTIRFFQKGEVFSFPKVPHCFDLVSSEVDFARASKDELMAAKWKPSQAKKVVKEVFGATLKLGGKKEDIVDRIIDIRERYVDEAQLV
jgi:hypothetical protein